MLFQPNKIQHKDPKHKVAARNLGTKITPPDPILIIPTCFLTVKYMLT